MGEFFRSAPVRAAMAEIQELQEDIMSGLAINGMRNPTVDGGLLHIQKMRTLLEKQRNFMFRLQLEKDDPDAIEMREQILESAKFLGLQPGQNIAEFFDTLTETLDKLEENIPDWQNTIICYNTNNPTIQKYGEY